jgi:DNA-directed RNA polymerase
VHIPTEYYDYKSIERGLMANFIHSLDAANIHILIDLITSYPQFKNINIYTIHDCFASTNSEMEAVEALVKEAFIKLYFQKNYLEELHNSLINQIKSYGDLTYDSTEGKTYFTVKNET